MPRHHDALRSCGVGGYTCRCGRWRGIRRGGCCRRGGVRECRSIVGAIDSANRIRIGGRRAHGRIDEAGSVARGVADLYAVALNFVTLNSRRIRRCGPIEEDCTRSLRCRRQCTWHRRRCRIGWNWRGDADRSRRPGNISRAIESTHHVHVSGSGGEVDVRIAGDGNRRDGSRASIAENAIAGNTGAAGIRRRIPREVDLRGPARDRLHVGGNRWRNCVSRRRRSNLHYRRRAGLIGWCSVVECDDEIPIGGRRCDGSVRIRSGRDRCDCCREITAEHAIARCIAVR